MWSPRRALAVGGAARTAPRLSVPRRHGSSFTALILGAPGGGKGTIGRYLARDFGFAHVSTGDLLRRHMAAQTEVGARAAQFVDAGELVPDDVMVRLVAQEAAATSTQDDDPRGRSTAGKKPSSKRPNGGVKLLLDGFPRTVAQAERLADVVAVDAAILLEVPREVLIRRLADRWVHDASGRTYAYDFNPPRVHGRDDDTGEPLVRRPDDEPDKVGARLRAFDENLRPILDFYDQRGLLSTFRGDESKAIYAALRPFLEDRLSASSSS